MAYDWKSIHDIDDPETRYYRLMGEMHQRHATASDLQQIKDFLLGEERPGPDALRSLGEALSHATEASEAGFKLWLAWSKTHQSIGLTRDQLRGTWLDFGAGHSIAEIDDLDNIIQDDARTDVAGANRSEVEEVAESHTGVSDTAVIRFPRPTLLSFVPRGSYRIRFIDQIYEDVDEAQIVKLLRRGLFLGAEIHADGIWVPVASHPDFEGLSRVMLEEVERVLGGDTHTDRTDTMVGSQI